MMHSFKMIIPSILLTFTLLEVTLALSGNGEICTMAGSVTSPGATNGTVVTTITTDTCDTSKSLSCLGGRCACKDQIHLIWTSREFKVKRSKRSPSPGKGGKSKSKGSTGKAVAAGAAAGVVGGVAGYAIAKTVDGASNGGSGSGSGSSSSSHHGGGGSSQKITIWSCYSRVGGDCVIDTSRTTLIEKSTTTVDAGGNTTTTIVKEAVDYNSYPKCVQGAECKSKRIAGGTDANIGECVCKDGYKKNNIDVCVSGVEKLTVTAMVFSILLAHFFVQK